MAEVNANHDNSSELSEPGAVPDRRKFMAVMAGIATAFGVSIIDKSAAKIVNEVDEKIKSYGDTLKKGSHTLYPVKRKIAEVLAIMDKAESQLDILGINSLGPLHQGMEEIKRILDNNGMVRVLLLDAKSAIFKRREKQECERQTDGATSSRLTKEWEASLEILKDLHIRKTKGRLLVRAHNQYPRGALVIGDNNWLQFNAYPTLRKNDMADATLPRGVSGETVVYKKTENPKPFDLCFSYFEKLWDSGKNLPLG